MAQKKKSFLFIFSPWIFSPWVLMMAFQLLSVHASENISSTDFQDHARLTQLLDATSMTGPERAEQLILLKQIFCTGKWDKRKMSQGILKAFGQTGVDLARSIITDIITTGLLRVSKKIGRQLSTTWPITSLSHFFQDAPVAPVAPPPAPPGRMTTAQRAHWNQQAANHALSLQTQPLANTFDNIFANQTSKTIFDLPGNLSTAISSGQLTDTEGQAQIFEFLLQTTADEIKQLPADFQMRIAEFDTTLQTAVSYLKQNSSREYTWFWDALRYRQELFLGFPTQVKNIYHHDKNGDSLLGKEIDRKVAELVDSYPEELRAAMDSKIQEFRLNSVLPQATRVQLYLFGAPGTGKTRFVRRLAETLDIHLCQIQVHDMKPETIEGSNIALHPLHTLAKDENFSVLIGEIAECLRTSRYQNLIIFFDEAGEYLGDENIFSSSKNTMFGYYDPKERKKNLLMSLFKQIADPSNKTLIVKSLGVELDFSRVMLAFAGNYPLIERALLERISQIEFPQLSNEVKRNALENAYLAELEGFRSIYHETSILNMNELDAILNPLKDYIVLRDQLLFPGARVIQAVMRETMMYALGEYNKEQIILRNSPNPLYWNSRDNEKHPLSEIALKRFIDQAFDRRKTSSNSSPLDDSGE